MFLLKICKWSRQFFLEKTIFQFCYTVLSHNFLFENLKEGVLDTKIPPGVNERTNKLCYRFTTVKVETESAESLTISARDCCS